MNKKVIALTVIAFCVLVFPAYKSFAKISLADAFKAFTRTKYVEISVFGLPVTRQYKWACASTRKEENGRETYEGRHYLRCYVEGAFGGKLGDTGRVWKDRGFRLEGGEVPSDDLVRPVGVCRAFYGDEND